MKESLAFILAFAMVTFFESADAQQPVAKHQTRDGIALWAAASDIDVLGVYVTNWLQSFEPLGSATDQPTVPRKDDGPSYLQAAASHLELAGPWALANGMMVR